MSGYRICHWQRLGRQPAEAGRVRQIGLGSRQRVAEVTVQKQRPAGQAEMKAD